VGKKPRLHRWQTLTGERAKADVSRNHNKMTAPVRRQDQNHPAIAVSGIVPSLSLA
jgi:hypothetical protein